MSKKGQLAVEVSPALFAHPPTDHLLQHSETLKGHGDGELYAEFLQLSNDLIAEEGAVHAHFD